MHAPCTDAECNVCRGDTHVIGPNPDTLIRPRTLADRCKVHGARFMVWGDSEWVCSRRGEQLDDGRGRCV